MKKRKKREHESEGRAGERETSEKKSIGIPRYRYANEEQGRRGRKKKAKWTPRSNEENAGG